VIPHASSVAIRLSPPRHGWLSYAIELGDFKLEDSASGVLNDPLGDMIALGIFLGRRAAGTHRVCLWGEPAGDALDVTNVDDRLAEVRVGWAADFIPPMTRHALEEVHRCTVEQMELAQAIRRAIDELFHNATATPTGDDWANREVYAAPLAQLRELVPLAEGEAR
jgi:hypothetical protein